MTRVRVGAVLLLLALGYLLGEALAVAGWEHRGDPYSWTGDTISVLGVPETMWTDAGRADSTRHAWMNATFVLSGARVALAALVLAPLLPRGRSGLRWVVLAVALGHGAGTVGVGLVPTGPTADRANGHGLAAALAIGGGTLLLLVLALALRPVGRLPAGSAAVLGLLSLAGVVGFVTGVGPVGLTERVAVDAVIVWQVLAGAALLLTPHGGEGLTRARGRGGVGG